MVYILLYNKARVILNYTRKFFLNYGLLSDVTCFPLRHESLD
jgi:hypothetical protein